MRTMLRLAHPHVLRTIAALGAAAALAVPLTAASNPPAAVSKWENVAAYNAITDPVARHQADEIFAWEQAHNALIPVHVEFGAVQATPDPANAAGDPCTTIAGQGKIFTGALDVEVAWFQMSTYWCWTGPANGPWNGSDYVTYHDTWISQVGLTWVGEASFWRYDGLINGGIQFYCFNWSGSNACSGNDEFAQAQFHSCVVNAGCTYAYPWLRENEYVDGAWGIQYGPVYIF